MAYRRLEEHVGLFRDYLRANSKDAGEEELLAAKFMGRWRSGAPLVLAPDQDDPELGADPMRNNDFNYKRWTRSDTRARSDRTPDDSIPGTPPTT